jgi:hypothetical protein
VRKPAVAEPKEVEPKKGVKDPPKTPFEFPPLVAHVEKRPEHPEQKRINAAIDRGVEFLRSQQVRDGGWMPNPALHAVGFAALPGLTLLECGAKPSDPAVQKAAKFVRNPSNIDRLEDTYDLALAILFLDRLGDKRDESLIQKLSLRLVAGQTSAGGWSYKCRVLPPQESLQLITYLKKTRPKTALPNPIPKSGNDSGVNPLPKDKPGGVSNPLPGKDGQQKLPNPIEGSNPQQPSSQSGNPEVPAKEKNSGDQPKAKLRQPAGPGGGRADFLPDFIKNLPIAQPRGAWPKVGFGQPKGKGFGLPGRGFGGAFDDNSNSQFALLALWAARRHDVPTERSLALAEDRYRGSQHDDGGWGYMIPEKWSRPAMTCVGLLGLAMGHGWEAPSKDGKGMNAKVDDAAIRAGLKYLGQQIGSNEPPVAHNLYYLWSLERVAVLYNLKSIGGKDWYSWGVAQLLPKQRGDGGWLSFSYPGHDHRPAPLMASIDTCFALLFLKRSNLVQDLTENLRLYMAITDPDSKK